MEQPGLNRRRFLLGASAALAGLGAQACAPKRTPIPPGGTVVVVGAGFAGLGAAGRLQERGFRVELIEARDRVGGRAHSTSLGGFPADLGANWLKLNNNALMPIAEERGLVSDRSNLGEGASRYDGRVELLAVADLEAEFVSTLVTPYLRYQASALLGMRPTAPTVEALIGARLAEDARLGCSARALLSGLFAADLDELSGDVLIGGGAAAGPAPDALAEPTVVGGMQALAQALAEPLSPRFGEHTRRIARTENGVEVTTSRRVIEADAAIVTVSIDILKKQDIEFAGGLPGHHLDALSGLDMGCFAKLWIRYPEAIWSIPTDAMVLCDSPNVQVVVDFSKSHGVPVLLSYAAGTRGRMLEAMSDDDAKRMLHETLQEQLQVELPAPVSFAKSRWTQDPLAGGSYMFPNARYRAGDHLRLREPIHDRILLAGEALADEYGYVDTAWSDGRRAADLLTS